eukprot:jgi/Tetstr1/447202/TSEL_034639.t1
MEAYAILALVGLGTIFSKRKALTPDPVPVKSRDFRRGELSDYQGYETGLTFSDVKDEEWRNAQRMARAARYPVDSGVIDANSRRLSHDEFSITEPVFSDLADREFTPDDFRHLNEQPFYGSKLTQYSSNRMNESKLEDHTGAPGVGNSMPKREVESFFNPAMGAAYYAGFPSTTTAFQSRADVPLAQNNSLPFEQVRVGPGVGQGYTAVPTGGFTQPQDREYLLPKTVDELRPLSNQKPQLEGRVIPGAAPEQRALDPAFAKNKQDTLFDISDRGMVATAGPVQARTVRPNTEHSFRRGPQTTREYMGAAGAEVNEPTPARPEYQMRGRVTPAEMRHAGSVSLSGQGRDPNALFSLDRALPNERVTGASAENYFGNPARVVGSAPADPLRMNGLRVSGREELQDSKRLYSNMSVQIPGQGPAFDLTDRARTTLRETMIHDDRPGNFGGNQGHAYANAFDPDSRFTVREHLGPEFNRVNVSTAESRGQAYNYDAPRSTTRETTHASRIDGVGTNAVPGGYNTSGAPEAFITKRELSHTSYTGGAGDSMPSGGYGARHAAERESQPELTNREVGHVARQGAAGGEYKKPVSYEVLYNETVRTVKDDVNRGRLFNGVGADKGVSQELVGEHRRPDIGLQTSRVEGGDRHYSYNAAGYGEASGETSQLPYDDRIDDGVMEYLRTNPFVVGLQKEVGLPAQEDDTKSVDPSRVQRIT